MRIAQEVAVRHTQLLRVVESTVQQRIGKPRWDLWFGRESHWSIPAEGMIRIEVETEFHADFIKRMLRTDLQAAVAQGAGTEWGFEVLGALPKSVPNPSVEPPNAEQIPYHGESLQHPKPMLVASPLSSVSNQSSGSLSDRSSVNSAIAQTRSEKRLVDTATTVLSGDEAAHLNADSSGLNARDVTIERNAFLAELREAELNPAIDRATIERDSISPEAAPRLQSGPCLRVVRDDSVASAWATAPVQDIEVPTARPIDPADMEMDRLLAIRRQNERRWEDLIVGEHNRFAATGAEMVLERPGQISPFLIHGPHGVGKTHLALALAQRLRQLYRYRRVLLLTGEQFTIEYTESAKGGGFASFRRKYRDVEALVIDDVQFCLGKAGTLVELRNTIDLLLRDKRQIILVSDRGLHELAGLGTDLYARLSGGMSCGIEPMDGGTRKQLMHRLCALQNVSITEEAIEQLSRQCGGDARVLHGIVHRLVARQRIQGTELSTDDALRCTLDLVRASQPIVRLTDIERVVCSVFGLGEEMLRAKTKCQSISQPRMLAMFLARKYTRSALSEIGEHFGNRQHSTVISAQKKVESWLLTDDSISIGHNRVAVREIIRSVEATLQVS
ncbi:MAG: DnaA/Hda family protein [Planctomycetota bacterium]